MPGKITNPTFDPQGQNLRGPCVEATFEIPPPMQKKLDDPLPGPIQIDEGLIDTGAVCTCLKASLAAHYLVPSGATVNLTVGGAKVAVPTYWSEVRIGTGVISTVQVAAITDDAVYDAIIGMDVLKHCRFEYEGPTKHLYLKMI